jgi:hypothetical protein
MDQLEHMCWAELDALYRASSVGKAPCGYLEGRAIYCQSERGAKVRTLASRVAWKGKHFEGCTMVNQWCGFRAVHARVFPGESWLDGKPSLIMDYRGCSRVWSDVRDELREVCPGLYLGIMYRDRCDGPKLETFFVLQGCPH